MFFALGALLFALINLIAFYKRKSTKWPRFISMAFMTVTVSSFYLESTRKVVLKEWASLTDTMPTINRILYG